MAGKKEMAGGKAMAGGENVNPDPLRKRFIRHIFKLPSGLCNFKQWLCLLEVISEDELFNRLQTYWNITSTISGLTAGFTYLNSNAGVTFTENGFIQPEVRKQICGSFVILAFILSLASALMSALLLGFLNLGGPQLVKWYTKRFWLLFDIPITVLVTGLVAMLISCVMSIGGMYNEAVYYFALAFGGIVFLIMLLVFIALRHLTHLELVEQQRKRVMAEQQPKFAGGDASPSSKVFSKLSGKFADEEEEDSCMMSSSIISPFCPEDV